MSSLPESVSSPRDRLGRALDDLRISVIDRCNFRCSFCMPAGHEYSFLPKRELLSFEEIETVARAFVELGVRKIRLTGGEPLLRREIEVLVRMLASIPGVEDLALTTNGVLLAQKAEVLREAGLRRVTVSLPALDDETFRAVSGQRGSVAEVIEGLEAAAEAGLGPIKVNAVVLQGTNDDQIVQLARFLKSRRWVARFIEYMDVGTLNGWDPGAVVSARDILERIGAELPLEEIGRRRPSDVALRFRYLDDGVEVGAIASVTEPFCGDCSRARLSAEGKLYTCLFSSEGSDLKPFVRDQGAEALREEIARIWCGRQDRYSEERMDALREPGSRTESPRIEMFRIGG